MRDVEFNRYEPSVTSSQPVGCQGYADTRT